MKIQHMKVNHIEAPMGFEVSNPSFSWVVESDMKIEVAKCQFLLKSGDRVIYQSAEQENIDCTGYTPQVKLTPRTKYQWQVIYETTDGIKLCGNASFETGKMQEPWQGKWITTDSIDGCPAVFQKVVYLDAITDTRVYMCGLGIYELYVNGCKVSNEYLAPGYHSYDLHCQVQTYEIDGYVHQGKNQIQVVVADGWFRGRLGFDGGYTDLYGNRNYALLELYQAGRLVAQTDTTWSWKDSPMVFSNIYDGEILDARKLWDVRENRKGWKPVLQQKPKGIGTLTDRLSLPIVAKEVLYPKVLTSPKGEVILDFQQNLTGWVVFDSILKDQVQVHFQGAEILQDGCFYNENLRTAKAEFTYISDGQKRYVRPHHTFFGFRYMRLQVKQANGTWENPPKDIVQDGNAEYGVIQNIRAVHLRSDFDEIGQIETGNPMVNQLFSNAMWGQKDNFLDVPTDCPQRDERLGWTGDAQIFSDTACYNMYVPGFYRKYMWDFRSEQAMIGGAGPNVVPRLKQGMVAEYGACPWADAAVVIPWNVYRHYGDKGLLKECYPGMKAWVDYQTKQTEEKHLISQGFHFGDWLSLDNPQPVPFGATDPMYIASAYYYKDTLAVAEAAEVLGFEEAKEYRVLAEEIRKDIQEIYFDECGLCKCKTQTGSALAIMFGLNPEGAMQREGDALAKRVEAQQNHLNTGFVGTSLLCPALTLTGHEALAMTVFLQEDYPSWLYSVKLGATTIWERWNSVEPDGHMNSEGMNSLNHYSYGSIESWVYGYVCGLLPMEPGFRKCRIAPHPDERLGYAKCTLDSSYGLYEVNWKMEKNKGSVHYEIRIPALAEAEFTVKGCTKILTGGRYVFDVAME